MACNKNIIAFIIKTHQEMGARRADDKAYRGRRQEQFHLANLKHSLRQCRKGKWVIDRHGEVRAPKTMGEMAICCGELKIACKLAIYQSGNWNTPLGTRNGATKVSQWVGEEDNEIVFHEAPKAEVESEEKEEVLVEAE